MSFIVTSESGYLVGVPYTDTLMIRWSWSAYDAYRFWRRSTAKAVAERVGGSVKQFDSLTGEVI